MDKSNRRCPNRHSLPNGKPTNPQNETKNPTGETENSRSPRPDRLGKARGTANPAPVIFSSLRLLHYYWVLDSWSSITGGIAISHSTIAIVSLS